MVRAALELGPASLVWGSYVRFRALVTMNGSDTSNEPLAAFSAFQERPAVPTGIGSARS